MNREFPYPLGLGTKATTKARREQRPTCKAHARKHHLTHMAPVQKHHTSHMAIVPAMNLQTSSLDIHTNLLYQVVIFGRKRPPGNFFYIYKPGGAASTHLALCFIVLLLFFWGKSTQIHYWNMNLQIL